MDLTSKIMQKIKVKGAKINRLNKKITVELHSNEYLFIEEEKLLEEHFKKHFETENLQLYCTVGNVAFNAETKTDFIQQGPMIGWAFTF